MEALTATALVRREASYRLVDGPSRLAAIHTRGLNTVVWRRPPLVGGALAAWLAGGLTHGAVAARDQLPTLTRGLPVGPARDALERDIAELARVFDELTGGGATEASLETVSTDKCRKLHADYKTLRLLCTYAGPGTEWVDDADVVRDALARDDGECFDLQNLAIAPRAGAVHRACPCDVVVLKGEAYPGNAGRGAVHRSPPIERTGERRLVLTLDVVP